MAQWPQDVMTKIAAADDLHIAPYHPDGITTGTLTWIWSVVVDDRLFVRAWNGTHSRWYQSAVAQRAGLITVAGAQYEVEFTPIADAELNTKIDAAYNAKYTGSSYLPPMVGPGPKAATVEITPGC